MSRQALADFEATLNGLRRKARHRILTPLAGVDFTSNDYIGLAVSARLRAATFDALARGLPVGSAGSRLLRGNHPEHEMLEAEAAAFFGSEAALFFANGFVANAALFSTLPQRHDLIVYDALIHASVHDGVSASKALSIAAAHNDVAAFDAAIVKWRRAGGKGHPWIAIESLYSMDGDFAPLEELAKLADRHDGFLVIDEAHATGVYGPQGRGLSADLDGRNNVVTLHTCGKAMGVSGALLCLPAVLADYLVNRAANFIYSTSPSPLTAATVREALQMIADEPQRQVELENLRVVSGDILMAKLGVAPSGSQIQPIPIGNNGRAMRIAAQMRADGFDLRAVRPPTVPEGTARLRMTITLNVTEVQVADMVERLSRVMAEIKA